MEGFQGKAGEPAMGRILVCGGGPIGLLASIMLARDGHEVTVLENDQHDFPARLGEAWDSWERKGVAQFRQPHNLFARFRAVCDAEVPQLPGQLLDAGCVWVDYLQVQPPGITDRTPRPGDDRFRFVTGRRPVLEAVVAAAAAAEPGVTIRRGVRTAGFLTGPSARPGVPHVAGVVTGTGEELPADLVVDAMGRRSPGVSLLTALGSRKPLVDGGDAGYLYYTRYFSGAELPQKRGRAKCPIGSITVLTLDGDNGTWSVTLYTSNRDPAVRALRDPDTFARVVAACPPYAHWLDGTPITGVLPMAGILDCYRRFVVGGEPVATGYAAIGDAWACTNPSAGRGLSAGAVHAQLLRHTVAEHLADPLAFALAFDEATEREVAPFYWNQIQEDRVRVAEMEALRRGEEPVRTESFMDRLTVAAGQHPDAYRALLEFTLCLAHPQELANRPELKDIVERHGYGTPGPPPGPDRAGLLALLSGG